MTRFNATYTRFNDDEATQGETDRQGFVDTELSLHDALRAMRQYPATASEYRGIAGSDWPADTSRWITADYSEWETGDTVEVSIGLPDDITDSTRARLVRAIIAHYGEY